ncbi:hypothetical protein ABW19_dt0207839 [Dactylella cylindrospora]|nr:hypothetical protein ABW19_dt0207839 [Dactylella cylindrospora]
MASTQNSGEIIEQQSLMTGSTMSDSGPQLETVSPTTTPAPPALDLSLYLVTSSDLLPPGATLESHVEAAIKGGVTIVQLREKKLDTRPFIDLGKRIHAVTRKYGVPLLINDRVDVAMAVGCEGAHIGWDDMDYETARGLLGPTAIIGVSVSSLHQATLAASTSCNYLGIGPVYSTATKPDANPPLHPSGVRAILEYLSTTDHDIPSVAIGRINSSNIQSVVYKSRPKTGQPLAGVAVVSAIIASNEPEHAASTLLELFKSPPPWSEALSSQPMIFTDFYLPLILSKCTSIIKDVKIQKPLVHHITNSVVKNFSANVTLAIGASPIMSENPEEIADLANISPHSSTLVNMGTSGPAERELFALAINENNKAGKPVVFDPVGAGATGMRRETVKTVMEQMGYVDVVKGNEGEIRTVAGEGVQMKGVDSGDEGKVGGMEELVGLVRTVAARETVVFLSPLHSRTSSQQILENMDP